MDGRDGLGRRALVALVAALALAIVPAACGDDDEDDSGSEEAASAETVTVTTADAEDGYTWDVEPTPAADTQSITYENQSEEPHSLFLARINEGFTFEEAYDLQGEKGSAEIVAQADRQTSPGPGETTEIEVTGNIEPGNYAIFCPIPGHYQQGQLEEFSIE
jgi:uncharacterized cupredoxin-like copper-binding protein